MKSFFKRLKKVGSFYSPERAAEERKEKKQKLIEEDQDNDESSSEDEFELVTKLTIMQQYKILFSDPCYVYQCIGGFQVFGIMGMIGGLFVQEAGLWGFSEVIYHKTSLSARSCQDFQ